jgi:hypothetical protein
MRRRFHILALALLGALALAGCGGTSSTGSGSSPVGASLVTADALVFVSVDSDLGSDQWQQADALSKKFPGRAMLLDQVNQELTKNGLDYDNDVKPALGSEVDIAIVTGKPLDKTAAVFLTKPDDPAKFKSLVAKLNAQDDSGEPAVYRSVGDWYAVGDSQDAITLALKGDGEALADDATFKDALSEVDGDALAKAYLSGQQLKALIEQAKQEEAVPFNISSTGLDKLDFAAAALSSEDDGVRLHGAAKGEGAKPLGGDFASELIKGVPADAFTFLTFKSTGLEQQLDQLESMPQLKPSLRQIEEGFGVSVRRIAALFGGETGFYIRPGAVIPEFTLVLTPDDDNAGLNTLDLLAKHIAPLAGAQFSDGSERTLDFGQFAVRYGASGGHIVLTNSAKGVSAFGEPGEELPDSADFKEAKSAAGLPDSNSGFVYVDLKDGIAFLESLAALGGEKLPSDVEANLRPLRSFLAWGSTSGDTSTFDAFLEIK